MTFSNLQTINSIDAGDPLRVRLYSLRSPSQNDGAVLSCPCRVTILFALDPPGRLKQIKSASFYSGLGGGVLSPPRHLLSVTADGSQPCSPRKARYALRPCAAYRSGSYSSATEDEGDGAGIESDSCAGAKSGQPAFIHDTSTEPPSVQRSVPRWIASCCSAK